MEGQGAPQEEQQQPRSPSQEEQQPAATTQQHQALEQHPSSETATEENKASGKRSYAETTTPAEAEKEESVSHKRQKAEEGQAVREEDKGKADTHGDSEEAQQQVGEPAKTQGAEKVDQPNGTAPAQEPQEDRQRLQEQQAYYMEQQRLLHQVTSAPTSLYHPHAGQPSYPPSIDSQQPLPESLSPDPPSKVIHFRNVTAEVTQEDIMELSTPFGPVEKVVMMRTKNQALIEFKDLASSISMSNFYINTQPNVRGRKVYMRFSRHQALTGTNCSVNKVLLVTLHTDSEPTIPITADVVWQIFSTYGFIEKIVVINKAAGDYTSSLQALVQYSSPVSGSTATQYLNGKTVYVGTDPILSITLYIQYSHLPQLTVKQNTAQARDYTQPLPWGPYYGYGYDPQADPYGTAAPPPPMGGAPPPVDTRGGGAPGHYPYPQNK